jgi:hypothetical protein
MESGPTPGAGICLELLPEFLAGEAQQLLIQVLKDGFDVGKAGEPKVLKFAQPARARQRGLRMIESIASAVNSATFRAKDENTGILPKTKADLIAAGKGMRDVKVLADHLDNFLLEQFPSYSLDTDVERATRANASVTNAIREKASDDNLTMRELLDLQRQTLAQLSQANETNARMLAASTAVSHPAAPPA